MKINLKKATLWNLFFIYSGLFISFIKGILIVPLYLKYIDIYLYGYWLATGNILMWLSLIDPGTGDVLQQRIGEKFAAGDKQETGYIITSGILISALIVIICLIIGILITNRIDNLIRIELESYIKQIKIAFQIAIIATCLQLFTFSLNGINRGMMAIKTFGYIMLFSNIIGLVTTVVALIYYDFGIIAISFGTLIAVFINFSLNSIFVFQRCKRERIPLKINFHYLKGYSKIFSYTFISKIGNTLTNHIDLIIISRFINAEMVTAYELTKRPIKFAFDFLNRTSWGLIPALTNVKGKRELSKFKKVFMQYFIIIILASTIITLNFLIFNRSLIPLWTGKQIYIGNLINILLCFVVFLSSTFYSFSNFSFAYGNIKGNSIINIIKSFIYLLLLLILVKPYGLKAVVISPLIAVISTELWYYPIYLIRNLKVKRNEINEFIILCLKYLIIGVIIYIITSFFVSNTWFKLTAYSIITTILFIISSLVLSRKLREIILFFIKWKY